MNAIQKVERLAWVKAAVSENTCRILSNVRCLSEGAYQMVVQRVYRGVDVASFKAAFWKWWIGLYADAPRKLRPMV
jgi:hypothetical protein